VNVYSGMLGKSVNDIYSELYFVVETIKFGQVKPTIAILELRDRLTGSGMDGKTVPMWKYDTETESFSDSIMVQIPRDTRLTYDDYKESIFSEKVTKNDPFLEIASTVNRF